MVHYLELKMAQNNTPYKNMQKVQIAKVHPIDIKLIRRLKIKLKKARTHARTHAHRHTHTDTHKHTNPLMPKQASTQPIQK